MTEQRKKLRRSHDRELEEGMRVLSQRFDDHVRDCSRNSQEMRAEVLTMRSTQETYHAQNKTRLEAISSENQAQLAISQEARDLLQGLVTARRVSIWAGKALRWVMGLLAAAAGAFGLAAYFKSP